VINPAGSQNNYIYNAGNNKTTFLTGMGFEFAKNEKRLFTLSVNYFKGLGNNATSFTSESAGKTTTTMLNSKLSGWGATLGIPISFTKKTKPQHRRSNKSQIRLPEIQNGMQVSMQKNYLNGDNKKAKNFFAFLIAIIIKCILRSVVSESIFFHITAYDNSFCTIVNVLDAIIIEIAI
jgi:hypothetical protein